MGSKYTQEFKQKVIDLYNNIKNYNETAKQTGVSQETVRTWCDSIVKQKYSDYRKEHREYFRNYNKDYHIKNVDDIHQRKQEHYRKNLKQIRLHRNQISKERYYNDIEFKLLGKLRSRLRETLKSQGIRKSHKAMELLGCTIKEFKQHIENQFTEGMTWDNHGKFGWHVDHIKPCCTFDLTKLEEQKKCFHYTNLQPLWWNDNLTKAKTLYSTI